MLRLLGRAMLLRILPERKRGVTPYYVDNFDGRLASARWMLQRCPEGTVLELGCGRDLFLSLAAAIQFGRRAVACDIAALADPRLLDYTARRLGHAGGIAGVGDLAGLGIEYRVATGLPDLAGVRSVASMAVLEHVPGGVLSDLFARAARSGVSDIVADIDLRDHWSFIAGVRPDHFYYIRESLWRILNGPRMHQNRMRFSDFTAMAISHGYHAATAEPRPLDVVVDMRRLNRRFAGYAPDDLAVGGALVHWRRTPAGVP